jgi:hypothetical protein
MLAAIGRTPDLQGTFHDQDDTCHGARTRGAFRHRSDERVGTAPASEVDALQPNVFGFLLRDHDADPGP